MSKASEDRSKLDEELRQLLAEVRLLEGSAQTLQLRLEIINSSLNEAAITKATLEGMKGRPPGTEILIPIGSGSFIRASLLDGERLIMGIGANVSMERSFDESISELARRIEELEKARASVQEQLAQILTRAEQDRSRIREILSERGGYLEVV
ncbi:MAG: prefoldin subunit alpha [Candidatus Bathyarchaeia archaeon]